jgi:hypothetical protein
LFSNCCYRVVKHTNQQNQDEIPCPLRVRSLSCFTQNKGPSFWRVLELLPVMVVRTQQKAIVADNALVWNAVDAFLKWSTLQKEREKAQLLERAQPSDSSHTAHLISFPLRQFTSSEWPIAELCMHSHSSAERPTLGMPGFLATL